MVGVVIAVREGDPPPKVRAIASVVGDEPAVPADLLAFLKDLSQYYLAPIGEVLRLALPPVEKEVARGLEEPTLFGGNAKGVGGRKVQWVTAADAGAASGGGHSGREGRGDGGRSGGKRAPRSARGASLVTHLRARW